MSRSCALHGYASGLIEVTNSAIITMSNQKYALLNSMGPTPRWGGLRPESLLPESQHPDIIDLHILPQLYCNIFSVCVPSHMPIIGMPLAICLNGEMLWHYLRQRPVRLYSLATEGEKEASWQLSKNEWHWKWRRPSNGRGQGFCRREGKAKYTRQKVAKEKTGRRAKKLASGETKKEKGSQNRKSREDHQRIQLWETCPATEAVSLSCLLF